MDGRRLDVEARDLWLCIEYMLEQAGCQVLEKWRLSAIIVIRIKPFFSICTVSKNK